VECSRGNDCEEDSQQSVQLPSVSDALCRSDIIVCTAGKLVDGLKKGNLGIGDISLLVLDECHNTDKGSNYAQVMHAYLEQKVDQKMQGNQLPQIVGLTATPGVGKNPGLNPLKEIDKLISLCAQVDATSGIKFVKENVEELNRAVPKAEYRKATVKQSEQRKQFIRRVVADMEVCESFLAFDSKFMCWSQAYEQDVKKMKTTLEESDNPSDKDKISTIRVLECLCQTLITYMDLPYTLATTPLKEFDDLNIPDKVISDHDKELKEMLTRLESDLAQLPVCENPILDKVKEILASRFQRNPKSEGIIFIRTREQAKVISKWISESKFAQEFGVRPHMLLGHKRPEETGPSMSDAEQKAVISDFHSGKYNLLVATSVAEEGLDIKLCNLVIRLHISSAKSKAQMQGRARAEDSEIITIMSDDPQKHYKDILNDEQLVLTEQVVQNFLPKYYDRFVDLLATKQDEIVESVKRQREAEKQRISTHPAQNVVLKCNKCKQVACRGSDLYVIDKTRHHVVPGDVLCYEIHEHRNPGMQVCEFDGSTIKKFYKVHCSNCGTSWGALGYWPKSKHEFPVLKCSSFNFFINGMRENFSQWKKRPFDVSPLSHWFAQNKSED
jgi:ERCC4-related helicase